MPKKKTVVLVVVESPGKIKKIQDILNSLYPNKSFIVMASYGHIMDIDSGIKGLEVNNNFKMNYVVSKNKTNVVSKLKSAYRKADEIIIATDKDREGEMIGWSVEYVLGIKNSPRAVFNEITKPALKKAIDNMITTNIDIVESQKARRAFDRVIGYGAMGCLNQGGGFSYSAGRVISVVTRLVVEKEDEIAEFMNSDKSGFFKFTSQLQHDETTLKYKMISKKRQLVKDYDKKHGYKTMKNLTKSEFAVKSVTTKNKTQNPFPPFTTASLQQEACGKLGWSVKRVMSTAQKLYERGKITYMRTDSQFLSPVFLGASKKLIKKEFGEKYLRTKTYNAKGKTQEGHEAVRPVYVDTKGLTGVGVDESRLYNIIWKRAVASQMSPAKLIVHTTDVSISKCKKYLMTNEQDEVKFSGFRRVYYDETKPDKPCTPNEGEELDPIEIIGKEEYERPPARFTEASLVNKLDPKNLNIGRPSTYASIIEKMLRTGYVTIENVEGMKIDTITYEWKGKKIKKKQDQVTLGQGKNKMVATDNGKLVTDYMVKHFPEVMEYKFTTKMEGDLDEIAEGEIKWKKVMKKFHTPFEKKIAKAKKAGGALFADNSRVIGEDKEGFTYLAMKGPKGDYIKKVDDNDKKKGTAPIRKPHTVDTVDMEYALEMFRWPKNLGRIDRKIVKFYNKGKFGPYVKWGKQSIGFKYSETVTEDTVDLEFIEGLIKEKEKDILFCETEEKYDDDGKVIYSCEYQVKNGQYGRYISVRSKKSRKPFTTKFPEKEEIEGLTINKLKEIIENGKKNKYKKRFYKKKKK